MELEAFVRENINWLGHASFRIKGSKSTVYIDPWKLKTFVPADVICITHSHFDHLSSEDVKKIMKDSTVVVGAHDCNAGFGKTFRAVAPGEVVTVGDVTIEAVPAYNTDKDFHPKKNKWVGYIITIDGFRIYHTGDTDVIPEMVDIKADVALLPVGGTYTMTVTQAVDALGKINPKIAVPMHCGDIVGSLNDRGAFEKASKTKVIILDPVE